MKLSKLFIAIAFLAFTFSSNSVKAQIMSKGDRIVKAGVGLGAWTTAYTTSETPLFVAMYEVGIKNDLGPGNLSVGGMVSYKSGRYEVFGSGWKYNYSAVVARASYHPHFVKSEKWDAYAGLSLGMYFVGTNAHSGEFVADYNESAVAMAFHLGARYTINEQFSAWAELGYGLGALSVGAAYKF